MAIIRTISCLTALVTLLCIITVVPNQCRAEDPQPATAEKNLFKTDNDPGVSQKSDPSKKAKKADASHLELYGTVILGEKKSALIFDNSKQQMDGGKKRRAGVYYLGDDIGGFVISAIEEKRVVLDYKGEEVILTLSEGKTTSREDYTPLDEASGQRKPPVISGGPEKGEREKPGSEPTPEITSPIMSPEEAEEIVEYSKEILHDIEQGGENADQAEIDAKKEVLKKMFMEKLERAEEERKEAP